MAKIMNSENDSAYMIHSSEISNGFSGLYPFGPPITRLKPPKEHEEEI